MPADNLLQGNTFPKEFAGDYIICEPVARIIRRAKVINLKGKIIVQNAYYKQEFIASTNEFRPVNSYTGPDGNLYIVDMHRGIIQQGNWTRPGSFLRKKIDAMGMAKNVAEEEFTDLCMMDTNREKNPKCWMSRQANW